MTKQKLERVFECILCFVVLVVVIILLQKLDNFIQLLYFKILGVNIMVKNEVGTEIPEHIIKKAKKMECLSTKFIYQDGKYGGKNGFPAANLGGGRATRFANWDSAKKHKIQLGDGWEIFKSPTYAKQNKEFRSLKTPAQDSVKPRDEPKIVQHIHGDYIAGQKAEIRDSVVTKPQINTSDKKSIKICPYCGEKLDFPEAPMFCPFCEKQILK